MIQIILDVETKKVFSEVGGYFPDRLGISFVGVCRRERFGDEGQMLSFFEDDMSELFPILEKADVVIGYNIDGFDMPAMAPYYSGDITKIPTLDIMDKIKDSFGHRIKLDSVAKETLGIGKIGDGLDAVKYYRHGQLDKLKEYCLQDVKVTRDVYDYGLRNGLVKFRNKWNRLIECNVDFSYKPQKDTGVQMTLL